MPGRLVDVVLDNLVRVRVTPDDARDLGRYGVQIQDQAVGGERERLGDHLLVAAGDEVERAPHAAAPRRRIIAARRHVMTSSPFWFLARCSKMTMPHCGRDFDSRFSTTSVSA